MGPSQDQQPNPQQPAQTSSQSQPLQNSSQNQDSSQTGQTPPPQEKKGHSKTKIAIILVILLGSIPIIAILLSVVLIAVNPERQFNQANDTKRASAVTQILNAVGAYNVDNSGDLPSQISTEALEIGSNGADICEDLVGVYLPSLPVDPSLNKDDVVTCDQSYSTGYYIVKNDEGLVTVSAPLADGDIEISITR